jgi:putative ABC transport system permease protein
MIDEHLDSLPDAAATWALVAEDSRYVLVDGLYGQTGGPQSAHVEPGTLLRLTDPSTGRDVDRIVAGVVNDGTAFYGIGGGEFRYPVFMSARNVWTAFPSTAAPSSLLLRAAPGEDPARLASDLQGQFVTQGVVATDIQQAVRNNFTANRQFFQLMRGYLALGLLVGITSLGVIMVRAVRERRRTIGVLRALGFGSRTVRRAFMGESTFVAVEGTIIGTVLGVVTTWVLYSNSPAFGTLDAPFPIAWSALSLTVGATLVASLLATLWPAQRAAGIRPAVAVRVAD